MRNANLAALEEVQNTKNGPKTARIVLYLVVIVVTLYLMLTITESVRSDYIKEADTKLPIV